MARLGPYPERVSKGPHSQQAASEWGPYFTLSRNSGAFFFCGLPISIGTIGIRNSLEYSLLDRLSQPQTLLPHQVPRGRRVFALELRGTGGDRLHSGMVLAAGRSKAAVILVSRVARIGWHALGTPDRTAL